MRTLFPGQQQDEKIIFEVRKHWFYLAEELLIWIIFVAALFAIDKYLPVYVPAVVSPNILPYFALFKNLYALFLILGLLMIWELYYLSLQIITSERIVDISQKSIFSHTVSELTMENIEDVTSENKGVLGTIFDFGNVYVQTAAHKDRFTFDTVPHPEELEKKILDLYEQFVHEKKPAQPAGSAQPAQETQS